MHLSEHDAVLAVDAILQNYLRFEPALRQAVRRFVATHQPDFLRDESGEKEFSVAFVNLPAVDPLRALKSEKIGTLCAFSGTVTRTSEVRPELLTGAFVCLSCAQEVEGIAQQGRYTVPVVCPNQTCNNRGASWQYYTHCEIYTDWTSRSPAVVFGQRRRRGSAPRTWPGTH